MPSQSQDGIRVGTMALLVVGTICAILLLLPPTVSKNAATRPQQPAIVSTKSPAPKPKSDHLNQLVSLSPGQVLATVNGTVIRLVDIIPLANTNGQITLDKVTFNYYLKRAVDRDLIFQKAQQQGVALDESQHHQLTALEAMRNQPEPGGIARMNDSPAADQMVIQDSEAFMLQTTLMAAQGDSPNVTEDQVTAYYTRHESEFGGQSLDSLQQDQQSWQQVEVEIRNELASSVRAEYNSQVANFMHNLESQANITMTPLAGL